MAYNEFPRKGYGRIFVEKEEDIDKVKVIIYNMDAFEYGYLPEDLITVFDSNIKTFPKELPKDPPKDHYCLEMKYTHKFDSLDLNELQFRCWAAGVKVFCVMDGSADYKYYEV